MEALCRRWRRQPKPAAQDKADGEYRLLVVDILEEALSGISLSEEASHEQLSMSPTRFPSKLSATQTARPSTVLPCKTAAAEIEAELYKFCGGLTAEFKTHARMLRANLIRKDNSVLRERVLSGELSPAELVSMKSEDLAPKSLQEERKKVQKEAMESVIDKDGVYFPKSPIKDADTDMKDYNMNMAPPPSPVREDAETEAGTQDVMTATSTPKGSFNEDEIPLPTPGPMPPPPTPFRMPEDAQQATPKHPKDVDPVAPLPSPDVLDTPREEEDELTILIQRLSERPI
jgi:hypothetical protein